MHSLEPTIFLCRLTQTFLCTVEMIRNKKYWSFPVVMGAWLLLASERTGSLWTTTDSQLQLSCFQCKDLHKNITITYRNRSFWCEDCSVIYINNLLMSMNGFSAAQNLSESAENVKWLVPFHCSPSVYQENNLLGDYFIVKKR